MFPQYKYSVSGTVCNANINFKKLLTMFVNYITFEGIFLTMLLSNIVIHFY